MKIFSFETKFGLLFLSSRIFRDSSRSGRPPLISVMPLKRSCNGGVNFNDATAIVARNGTISTNADGFLLVKYGNSNALVLDKTILALLDLEEGSLVKMTIQGNQLMITAAKDVDVKDNIISDVSYRARGCAISVASASIMSSIIKGKTIEEVNILFDKFHKLCTGQTIEDDDDTEMLQVLSGVSKFPTRVKCATMSWHAIKEATHSEN